MKLLAFLPRKLDLRRVLLDVFLNSFIGVVFNHRQLRASLCCQALLGPKHVAQTLIVLRLHKISGHLGRIIKHFEMLDHIFPDNMVVINRLSEISHLRLVTIVHALSQALH